MNYYYAGFYFLLIMWLYYILDFRWLIRSKVYAGCSKTYIRKNCRGFLNKLFYTPVKDRCRLGRAYSKQICLHLSGFGHCRTSDSRQRKNLEFYIKSDIYNFLHSSSCCNPNHTAKRKS